MVHVVRGTLVRHILLSAIAVVMGCLAGCGGGGSSSSSSSSGSSGSSGSGGSGSAQVIASAASNVASIIVDCGPSSICNTANSAVNLAFVTVTVCNPTNGDCQTFDHIQVDTQSYGLRLIGDATDTNGNPVMVFPPENQTESNEPLAECAVFADGYSWGPLVTADVTVSGETTATSVPVQVIASTDSANYSGYSNTADIPSDCQNADVNNQEDTVATFGANGVLGVGPFVSDCGEGCTTYVAGSPTYYYICPSPTSCTDSYADVSQQVANPVGYFPVDNNGVIVELPSISSGGALNVAGALVFGIGTEDNNALGSATVFGASPDDGSITTDFNGSSLTDSVLDSGSNGFFFNDSSINPCSSSNNGTYFYCPSSTLALSASIASYDGGTASTVAFSVANADDLSGSDTAFNDLAGNLGSGFEGQGGVFDWGLSFYFGRNVFTAIDGENTPAGEGPYYAF